VRSPSDLYPGARGRETCSAGALIKRGILLSLQSGDVRQSGTSGSPSILNANAGSRRRGWIGDSSDRRQVRIDLNKGSANILYSEEELTRRRADLRRAAASPIHLSQTQCQDSIARPSPASHRRRRFATRYQRYIRGPGFGLVALQDNACYLPSSPTSRSYFLRFFLFPLTAACAHALRPRNFGPCLFIYSFSL